MHVCTYLHMLTQTYMYYDTSLNYCTLVRFFGYLQGRTGPAQAKQLVLSLLALLGWMLGFLPRLLFMTETAQTVTALFQLLFALNTQGHRTLLLWTWQLMHLFDTCSIHSAFGVLLRPACPLTCLYYVA